DAGRQTLSVDHPPSGWKVDVDADRVDTVGSRLWEMRLTRTRPPVEAVSAGEQGQRIADRVTGLLEPLALVEADGERNVAQLRSRTPTRQGDAADYYEVVRHSDGATRFGRYRGQRTAGGREPVPFSLTHEVLGKLLGDLAD
ncbi:MAG: hypothetical protein U0736_29030, partial [Gemmataceae bacterium]